MFFFQPNIAAVLCEKVVYKVSQKKNKILFYGFQSTHGQNVYLTELYVSSILHTTCFSGLCLDMEMLSLTEHSVPANINRKDVIL